MTDKETKKQEEQTIEIPARDEIKISEIYLASNSMNARELAELTVQLLQNSEIKKYLQSEKDKKEMGKYLG